MRVGEVDLRRFGDLDGAHRLVQLAELALQRSQVGGRRQVGQTNRTDTLFELAQSREDRRQIHFLRCGNLDTRDGAFHCGQARLQRFEIDVFRLRDSDPCHGRQHWAQISGHGFGNLDPAHGGLHRVEPRAERRQVHRRALRQLVLKGLAPGVPVLGQSGVFRGDIFKPAAQMPAAGPGTERGSECQQEQDLDEQKTHEVSPFDSVGCHDGAELDPPIPRPALGIDVVRQRALVTQALGLQSVLRQAPLGQRSAHGLGARQAQGLVRLR